MNEIHFEMVSQESRKLSGLYGVSCVCPTCSIMKEHRNQPNLRLIPWNFKAHWAEAMKVLCS